MEQQKLMTATLILALATTSFFAITSAQSSSCMNVLISLSPCLDYITGNSTTPTSSCCKQLTTVVQSQPLCLCQVLNGGSASSLGISINQTQAMNLPTACKIQMPSISKCTSAKSPTGSAATPSSGTSGSSGSSVPTTSDGSSDGSTTKLSFSLVISLLFVASCASAFSSV